MKCQNLPSIAVVLSQGGMLPFLEYLTGDILVIKNGLGDAPGIHCVQGL